MIMKRKTIYHIIGLLAAVCCLWSCQEEVGLGGDNGNGKNLILDMVTRASDNEEEGNPAYNENTITRADVFFFETAEGNCIYAQTGIKPSPDNKLQVTLSSDVIKLDNQYHIYVVANHDFDYTPETAVGVSIADIKDKVITTVWKDGLTNIEDVTESSLVMDGEADVIVSVSQPGTVNLTRAMAKIAVFPTAEDQIVVGEGENKMTYTPVYGRMNVTLVNGVKSTKLSGDYSVQAADYVVRMKREFADEDKDGSYTHVPFYSYPNPVTIADRKDSYLILCLPWSMEGQGTQQALNYYYRIPITKNNMPAELLRNNYYKINVHVGVLGSLDPKDAVTLEGDFKILDWSTMELSTEMQNYQYLVLDEYHSVMNNVNDLEMPYISSSDIDWSKTKITKVTYPNYNAETEDASRTRIEELTGNKIAEAGFSLTETESGKALKFSHEVTNQDYVPFTITIDVYNKQGVKINTPWTIIQYPAIYIVGDYNQSGTSNRFIYNKGGSSDYVSDDDDNTLGGVNTPSSGWGGSTNNNRNQYTIYVTSFDIGDDYVIGDPRSEDVDNLRYLQKQSDGSGKHLTYYYPTKKKDVEKMVAPAFKIASSWGVVNSGSLSYETAQRRCASYQENGYPAGRWRVPTEAEILYIVGLSDRGVIPVLFNGDYYASSGRYYDNGYEGSNRGFFPEEPNADGEYVTNGHSVRCVYDVWYWGNDKLSSPNKFTWGDEERK